MTFSSARYTESKTFNLAPQEARKIERFCKDNKVKIAEYIRLCIALGGDKARQQIRNRRRTPASERNAQSRI